MNLRDVETLNEFIHANNFKIKSRVVIPSKIRDHLKSVSFLGWGKYVSPYENRWICLHVGEQDDVTMFETIDGVKKWLYDQD